MSSQTPPNADSIRLPSFWRLGAALHQTQSQNASHLSLQASG